MRIVTVTGYKYNNGEPFNQTVPAFPDDTEQGIKRLFQHEYGVAVTDVSFSYEESKIISFGFTGI